MKTLLIPVVASAAVLFATPAHADDQAFMNYMVNHGNTTTDSHTGVSCLTWQSGYARALQGGVPPNSEIGRQGASPATPNLS